MLSLLHVRKLFACSGRLALHMLVISWARDIETLSEQCYVSTLACPMLYILIEVADYLL
jgi:hypothetical protein